MYQNDLNQIIMTVDEFNNLNTNPSENIKELIELYGGETTLDEVLEYLVEQENSLLSDEEFEEAKKKLL